MANYCRKEGIQGQGLVAVNLGDDEASGGKIEGTIHGVKRCEEYAVRDGAFDFNATVAGEINLASAGVVITIVKVSKGVRIMMLFLGLESSRSKPPFLEYKKTRHRAKTHRNCEICAPPPLRRGRAHPARRRGFSRRQHHRLRGGAVQARPRLESATGFKICY